jgi:hypothetical protein
LLTNVLRDELTTRAAATASQIDKVIEDTSKRLLCTVILGVLGISDSDLRDRLAKLFDIRNGIAHGKKTTVSRSEAQSAIDAAESFMAVAAGVNGS